MKTLLVLIGIIIGAWGQARFFPVVVEKNVTRGCTPTFCQRETAEPEILVQECQTEYVYLSDGEAETALIACQEQNSSQNAILGVCEDDLAGCRAEVENLLQNYE